jgi:hypothetical protein
MQVGVISESYSLKYAGLMGLQLVKQLLLLFAPFHFYIIYYA